MFIGTQPPFCSPPHSIALIIPKLLYVTHQANIQTQASKLSMPNQWAQSCQLLSLKRGMNYSLTLFGTVFITKRGGES